MPVERRRGAGPRKSEPLTDRQRQMLKAIDECGGNMSAAARALGIQPATLRKSMIFIQMKLQS